MPVLRNPWHERAAQHLAAGKPSEGRSLVEEAAELGGLDVSGKSFRSNARKFCQRKDIKARVASIQSEGAHLAAVSTGSLIMESEDARCKAMRERGGAAAAISAIQTKAKLAGLWRDKVALTDPSGQNAVAPFVVEIVRFSDAKSEIAA